MPYACDDLLTTVKIRAMVPESQNTFADTDILTLATHEILSYILPTIMDAREEYYVKNYDYSIVGGTSAYRIPYRAVGGGFRDLMIIDGSNNYSYPNMISPEDLYSTGNQGNLANDFSFYIQGEFINLVPTPSSTQNTLRFSYYQRPNDLVVKASCAQVTVITASYVTVSAVPSTMITGVSCDIIRNNPNYDWLAIDQAITNVSGSNIYFASIPSTLAVGDWIALAGQSPYPQIPLELHPLLYKLTEYRILKSQGMTQEAALSAQEIEEMKDKARTLLTPRAQGEPKRVFNRRNPLNYLSRRLYRWGR